MTVQLRTPTTDEIERVAAIWHAGWRDGHLGFVPDELLAHRTLPTFVARVRERLDEFVVARVDAEVAGFVVVADDEVEQIYVDGAHRGSGVADTLMSHALDTIATSGHDRAWLAVVGGNERARAFYAKQGWTDEGPFTYAAATASGAFDLVAHRYARPLR